MFRIAKAKFSGAADSKTDEFEEVQETKTNLDKVYEHETMKIATQKGARFFLASF